MHASKNAKNRQLLWHFPLFQKILCAVNANFFNNFRRFSLKNIKKKSKKSKKKNFFFFVFFRFFFVFFPFFFFSKSAGGFLCAKIRKKGGKPKNSWASGARIF